MGVKVEEIWDNRHRATINRWNDIESVVIHPYDGDAQVHQRHIISTKHNDVAAFDIDSLYVAGNTDVLIVALHGALIRNQVELPRFEWLAALESRNDHKLFLADTALSHSEILTLGWFIGNEKDDLTKKLAEYIKHITKELGIKKTIFVGSSGGGYAALAIATYIENSNVVAFTPQTDVWKFSKGHTKNLLSESFSEYQDEHELSRLYPERFSLIERYKKSDRLNKFIYIQNTGDVDHLNTHFKPFAQSLGVRLNNGRTFDQKGRFISFFHGNGHVAPPKERLNEFVDLAITDLDTPIKTAVQTANLSGELSSHTYIQGHNSFESVPAELNSYFMSNDQPLRVEAANLDYTEQGVPLRVLDGIPYDHPVLQAQFMLKHLNTLRRNGPNEYSDVLHATAKRLIGYAIESRGALFLPFKFPWNAGKQQPPWFSAMAQGQVLSAISRLHELEPRKEYEDFAKGLLASFELLPVSSTSSIPWVVDIDTSGHLWLEEYPHPGQGKCVLNGHLFAVWGLYDYWRVFNSKRALTIANAALETTKKYIRQSRTPNWSSHYDLTNFFLIRNYHQTHIWQMEVTYNLTGNPFFLEMADLLESDFPSYQRNGSLYLAKGEHEIHRMDNIAVPSKSLEKKTISLDKAKAYNFTVRTKVEELNGVWLRFSDGDHTDWWVKENSPKVFPRLCFDKHIYARPRKVVLIPNTYYHNSFNEWGAVIEKEEIIVSVPTTLSIKSKAMWNGVWYFEIGQQDSSAIPAGRWISPEGLRTI